MQENRSGQNEQGCRKDILSNFKHYLEETKASQILMKEGSKFSLQGTNTDLYQIKSTFLQCLHFASHASLINIYTLKSLHWCF